MASWINETTDNDDESQPQWQAIGTIERRILGVLVEKSKTTPSAYPLTTNAIRTAANQKSNRNPLMQLSTDDVDEALIDLRQLGVVAEIQGDGRTAKYKHKLYNWMGVEKVELAVMAELLLRGEQTLGELRGRAARMEKIADVAELRPIVSRLIEKNLIVALTPSGRGQIVTHNLYLPQQLEKLRSQIGSTGDYSVPSAERMDHSESSSTPTATAPTNSVADNPLAERVGKLEAQVAQLLAEVKSLSELISS